MLADDNPIPYAILFGANHFMVFSLFVNQDTPGKHRYGLLCSNIIATSSVTSPLIPLAIFALLGKGVYSDLKTSHLTIPPTRDPHAVQQIPPITRSKFEHFRKQPNEQQASSLLNTV
jgi:hypothetical protein